MIFTMIIVSRTFKQITIKLNKIFAINVEILYISYSFRVAPLKLQILPGFWEDTLTFKMMNTYKKTAVMHVVN